MSSDAKRVVTDVVGDGYEWWVSSGEQALLSAATFLLLHGVGADEAADVIGAVWAASAAEFGA